MSEKEKSDNKVAILNLITAIINLVSAITLMIIAIRG